MEVADIAWRRLTNRQYQATLRDLLAWTLGSPTDGVALLGAVDPELRMVPVEERKISSEDLHGSFRRLNQDVSDAHVLAWYNVARAVGQQLSSPTYLGRVLGSCGVDSDGQNDAQCISDFVASFGARALRRPLTAEEQSFYAGFYAAQGIDGDGLADVVAGILSAPQFLYIVEHGTNATDNGRVQLSAFELASRLSYHFWGTMPDETLWGHAEDGSLLEDAVYRSEVDRLFNDRRTRETTREFFRDWLKLEDLPELDARNDSPLFQAFAGTPLPSDSLREAMIDDALDMLQYYTWTERSGLSDVLLSELSFARSQELADLYGIEVWDGSSAPPAFPQGQRTGLLTRAAFLTTGSPNTRPVMKGLFIRRYILCDSIPPPPNNAAANTPELSDNLSTREVVEELTEQPGTPCAACHEGLINPMGFATENFDALGRLRSEQMLIDEGGAVLGTAPVDTRTVPQVLPGDDTEIAGASELMGLIVDSKKATACLARQYFRYSYGRFEHPRQDGCALEQLRSALADGGNIADMLRQVAQSPEFSTRGVE